MKKYYRLLVIFLILSCWIPHIASAQVVNVPDPNLAEALRGALGLAPNAPITRQDVQRLGGFLAVDTQIRNLTGLEHATQLERLDLRSNQISNLTPLARLTQLEVLILANNQISNITALAGLTRLRVLALDGNRVSNLAPLARLTQLERLFLIDNQVSNLAPLAGLTQLTELYLDHNQIRNISPLTRLSKLKWLALKGNQISNLNPLARMTQLERLALEDNQIRDVTPLRALTNLTHLFLKDNQIRDVSALARLVNLRQLILAGNPIQDTSPLASLTNLDVVDVKITAPTPPRPVEPRPDPPRETNLVPDAGLAAAVRRALGLAPNATITKQTLQRLKALEALNRQITDLTGLENATQLERLELNLNRIQDVSPLAGLTQLVALNLSFNQIQDVSPLAGLTQLVALNLSENQVQDVNPLVRLTRLERLYLNLNQIQDVSPLARMTRLMELGIAQNEIRDVSPLTRLVNLKKLWLVGNPITDTSPLASLPKLATVDVEITEPVVQVEATQHPPMYWIDTITGTLHRLVNAEMENLVPNVRNATYIAIDVANEKVYWTEEMGDNTGRIRRANLDGTNVRLVVNLRTAPPHSMALDTAGGKIYITNGWGKIQRLNIDGSNFEPNLITELDAPGGLILDVAGDKIYWTEKTGRIRRASLDGSYIQDIATGLANPLNIATSGDTIYWTEKTGENSGEIRFVNLLGTPNVRTRHSFSQDFPVGLAVDAVEKKLYWTTSRGNIGRSNFDGSNFQPNFVTGLIAPGAFALNVERPVIDLTAFHEQLTDPDSDGGGKWIDLKEQDISLLPTLKSQGGNTETVIIIVNNTEAEIAYYWVDYEGSQISYGEIAPGDFANQHTYAGHVWLIKDASGRNLTVFRTVEKTGRALIEEASKVKESPEVKLDVNSDGVVNIQDLVLVASNFGQTGANAADVNGDGVVNITDLVKVAGALGNAAAAPSLSRQALAMFTTADVRQWLTQAQHLDLTDATSQRGIRFLEQLLTALIPKESALLPNYPNPFNPETWIPYQLAKPADVTLTIYGVDGKVVRRSVLGHQLAGTYRSKGRAAYWDGRNAVGEPVASVSIFTPSQPEILLRRGRC